MPDDDPMWPTLSLDDAPICQENLDRRYPPGSRYPDHRDLLRTDRWHDRHGQRYDLNRLDQEDLENLLQNLRADAVLLHAQAASDEQALTSSALSWALHSLDVPPTAHVHPLVWLDATALVRALMRRIA